MAQEILLTSAGLKELETELEDLRVRGRQEIKEKIQVALSFGDLSENSEYEEARNDQGKLEARISEIEDILSRAKLIDEDALSTDVIQMGSKVTIKDIEYGDIYKYQIISSTSTSKDKGVDYLTSDESPDSSLCSLIKAFRLGEPISSSPSNMNLTLCFNKLCFTTYSKALAIVSTKTSSSMITWSDGVTTTRASGFL